MLKLVLMKMGEKSFYTVLYYQFRSGFGVFAVEGGRIGKIIEAGRMGSHLRISFYKIFITF